jgi:hypothetical protein
LDLTLCEEIDGKHQLLLTLAIVKTTTVNSISLRFSIPRRSLRRWMGKYKSNLQLHENGGRPLCIDSIGLQNVSTKVKADRSSQNATRFTKLKLYFIDERKETKKRRGLKVEEEDSAMDPRTLKKFKSSTDIVDRKPQLLAEARRKALLDIRVTYRLSCLLEGEYLFIFLHYFSLIHYSKQHFLDICPHRKSGMRMQPLLK